MPRAITPREATVTLDQRRIEQITVYPDQPAVELVYTDGLLSPGGDFVPVLQRKAVLTENSGRFLEKPAEGENLHTALINAAHEFLNCDN